MTAERAKLELARALLDAKLEVSKAEELREVARFEHESALLQATDEHSELTIKFDEHRERADDDRLQGQAAAAELFSPKLETAAASRVLSSLFSKGQRRALDLCDSLF